MSWRYPQSGTVTVGDNITLTDYQNIWVTKYVFLANEGDGSVITVTGANHTIEIDGIVASNAYIGVLFTDGSSANSLNVSSTAEIRGFYGVSIHSNATVIKNYGSISADYNAFFIRTSSSTATTLKIENHGIIQAEQSSAIDAYSVDEDIILTNTDTIKGNSYAFYGGEEVNKVFNSGTIEGDIQFNTAADVYDGRAGKIKGIVSGGAGSDKLYGGKEANLFHGDAGKDRIYGAGGADKLYGGDDSDTFVFQKTSDSTTSVRDVIYDFNHIDTIDLHSIDAATTTSGNQTFSFIGSAAYGHHAGELRYSKSGGDTLVYGDTNGDGKSDFSIKLAGSFTMEKGDFLL